MPSIRPNDFEAFRAGLEYALQLAQRAAHRLDAENRIREAIENLRALPDRKTRS